MAAKKQLEFSARSLANMEAIKLHTATSAMSVCSPDEPGCGATQQYEFAVDGGSLLVTNLQIFNKRYGLEIVGTATNKTSLNLNGASFFLQFFNKNNESLGKVVIPIQGIKVGESKQFTASDFLQIKRPSEIESIKFIDPHVYHSYSYVFSMKKPKPSGELRFEDNQVSFQFEISDRSILLNVMNNTDDPVTIDWNNLAYIDTASNSHRVFHNGVKYNERENLQVQTMIPPRARIQDAISPSDYVILKDSTWTQISLLPSNSEKATGVKGQTIGLFIPLDINGHKKNYSFTFNIDDVLIGQ